MAYSTPEGFQEALEAAIQLSKTWQRGQSDEEEWDGTFEGEEEWDEEEGLEEEGEEWDEE